MEEIRSEHETTETGGGQQPAPVDPAPGRPLERPRGVLLFHPGYFCETAELPMDCLAGATVTWRVPTEDTDRELREKIGLDKDAAKVPDAAGRRAYFEAYVIDWREFRAVDGSDVPFTAHNRDRLAERAEAFLLMMLEMRERLFEVREEAEKN